jgi:hypothetical protein
MPPLYRSEEFLLAPPFLCMVLWKMSEAHLASGKESLPIISSFIGGALVLTKRTRERVPATKRTDLVAWTADNPTVMALLPERIRATAPYVRAAYRFGLLYGALTIHDGRVEPQPLSRARTRINALDGAGAECVVAAIRVGRWFSTSGTPSQQMSAWAVRL